eukprot:Gb_01541 [translate_table: standard]
MPVLPPTWCSGHFSKVVELIQKHRENAGRVEENREKTFIIEDLHHVAYEIGEGLNLSGCMRLVELPEMKSLESLTGLYLGGGEKIMAVLTLPEGLVHMNLAYCS